MEAPNEDVEPGEATSAAAQQGTKAITLPQLPFIPNLPISVRKDRCNVCVNT